MSTIASSSPTVAVCTWPISKGDVDQSAPSSAARTDCTCAAGIAIDDADGVEGPAASRRSGGRRASIFCASLSVAPRIFVLDDDGDVLVGSPLSDGATFETLVAAALSAIFDAPAASAAARAAAVGTAFSVRFARLTSSARPKTTRSADVGSALRHVSRAASSPPRRKARVGAPSSCRRRRRGARARATSSRARTPSRSRPRA